MSIREVITYPNPILRKKSEVVEEINGDLKQLVEDMAETMYGSHGIGWRQSR